jgi:amidophosphoribosyltransferase
VYLARPDSVIDGISVYESRRNMGKSLAERILASGLAGEIDVVIPIPDSSRPSALEVAAKLSKPYREGFIKNRYVGRTFIMPGQELRKKSVRQKLNAMAVEFRDTATCCSWTTRSCGAPPAGRSCRWRASAGARKVYIASAAPPVRFPNVYGIDMPTRGELIAHGRTLEEIRQYIGCDALIYQDVDAMKHAVQRARSCCASRTPMWSAHPRLRWT